MEQLDLFVTAKLASGLSPKTVNWYAWMLSCYRDYCQECGLDYSLPHSAETFLVHMRQTGAAAASVTSYYRAMHVYFGWLVKRGFAETNPMAVIDKPRIPRRLQRHVTLVMWKRIYEGIEHDEWWDNRDRALLVVMFYSGLRVGEVVGMASDDVDLHRYLITVRRGKGGHERLIPCAPLLCAPLRAYLADRPTQHRGMWLSNDGSGGVRGLLTAEGVRMMLRRRCVAVGIPYQNPHLFRHGYAMTMLNAGMGLSAVSAAMGHSSTVVTEQVYASWLVDGLTREYSRAMLRLGA
jgi:integrase/recombinase XerD